MHNCLIELDPSNKDCPLIGPVAHHHIALMQDTTCMLIIPASLQQKPPRFSVILLNEILRKASLLPKSIVCANVNGYDHGIPRYAAPSTARTQEDIKMHAISVQHKQVEYHIYERKCKGYPQITK